MSDACREEPRGRPGGVWGSRGAPRQQSPCVVTDAGGLSIGGDDVTYFSPTSANALLHQSHRGGLSAYLRPLHPLPVLRCPSPFYGLTILRRHPNGCVPPSTTRPQKVAAWLDREPNPVLHHQGSPFGWARSRIPCFTTRGHRWMRLLAGVFWVSCFSWGLEVEPDTKASPLLLKSPFHD